MIPWLTSGEQATKFPAHSALLKRKRKAFGSGPWEKNVSADKR